jgi:hypothetical protein
MGDVCIVTICCCWYGIFVNEYNSRVRLGTESIPTFLNKTRYDTRENFPT